MKRLADMTHDELVRMYRLTHIAFIHCKSLGLKLNMSRGKPGNEQLNLSAGLVDVPISGKEYLCDGIDIRNYGTLEGLPSCRKLFAEILGVRYEQVFVGGNASLTLMYDIIAKAYTHGLLHSKQPWSKLNRVKFLCPSPGYDRHFSICKSFGMEMITVPMTQSGPDMDIVEELVKDENVKGMWCVPKFSNPDGIIYSDETIRRIASLRPAADDFTVMWDNAYCIHEFNSDFISFANILDECERCGNPDMVFEFCSTSKVTFPGAGVACFACSEANMEYMKRLIAVQSISSDKVNQYRHVRFLKDKAGAIKHMKKHAAILKPKFDIVLSFLDNEIAPFGFARWHEPKGGYFVSLNTMNGCAKRTHQLCTQAGVVMTEAGATFPNGIDPNDSNLRIAPSYPPEHELRLAMRVLCTCLKLAAVEKMLGMY